MKNYLLSIAVLSSLGLSLTGVALVSARSVNQGTGQPIINRAAPVNEYFSTMSTFVSAEVDSKTGLGTLTTSRQDDERGAVKTIYAINSKTAFLKRHGGSALISDFRAAEEISVYALRNHDGSLTALKVTNNQLWFLDPVIQEGEITKVDHVKNTLTVKISATGVLMNVAYGEQTLVQKPNNSSGQETDLVLGKKVKVRGVVRKTGDTTAVEQTMVIWLLPEHGEQP